jgi:Leucine-rich repeat (LRR) protein
MDTVEIQKSGLKLTILDIESIWEQFKLSKVTLVDLSNNLFENIDFFVGAENISIFEDFVSLKTLILSGNPIK